MTARALATGSVLLLLAACGGDREVPLEGTRYGLRDAPTVAAQAPGLSLPGAVANADWLQRGRGASHDVGHVAASASPQPLFAVPIGEPSSRGARITAEPVVAGGVVYTLDARATVTATTASGATAWTRSVLPPSDEVTDASGGGLAVSGGDLIVATGYGRVTALDLSTGNVRWTQDLNAPPTAAPTVADGRVIVVARDGRAYALDAGTGRIAWQAGTLPAGATWAGGAGAAAGDGIVVLPMTGGEVIGVFPDGGLQRWLTPVAGRRPGLAAAQVVAGFGGDPVIADGTVYVGNSAGRFAALDAASGASIWQVDEGASGPAVVAGGSLFLVNDRGELLRLDAGTGTVLWRVALPRAEVRRGTTAHLGPLLAGGRLWVAGTDGALRAYDPASGATAGGVSLGAGAASAPVAAGGTIYVVTEDGVLRAFR